MFRCLLFRFIEFIESCIFLCRLVLCVSTLTKGLAMLKGFPYKDQIEELFIVTVNCMYSQHVTLSTFSLILPFFDCDILIKGTIEPICAESAVKPQLVNSSVIDKCDHSVVECPSLRQNPLFWYCLYDFKNFLP